MYVRRIIRYIQVVIELEGSNNYRKGAKDSEV